MVLAFSVPVPKAKAAAKRVADDEVPDFEVPNGVSVTKKSRQPDAAPFELGLYKFSDDCTLFGFTGPAEAVVLAIYDHAAYPSLVFKQAETREQFHDERSLEDENFPKSAKVMDTALELKQVIGSDPPLEGMVAYRRGTYMKQSAVITYVDYMDTYLFWRQQGKKGGVYPDVEMNITNCTGVTLDMRDPNDRPYECTITWKTESPGPFDVFSVPSVSWLKVFPEVSITKLSAATVKVRFGGDTWSFRSQFTNLGIPGLYENSDGQVVPSTASQEEKRSAEYVRLIKSINVKERDPREFLKNVFGNSLFKGTMVKVTWTGACTSEEPVHALKTTLEGIPNVCLRAGPCSEPRFALWT
jgi:hypothetical protein